MNTNKEQKNEWSIYIIRCSNHSLYTGISNNVQRRFEEHCSNSPKSAKYLKGKGPLKLLYSKDIGNRSQASKCELAFKKFPKKKKEEKLLNRSELDGFFKNFIKESS